MNTAMGIMFSMTLVALALASSQYTSRILCNFMRSRVTQVTLGVSLLAEKGSDLQTQIAKRVYELYAQQGRRKGHADQGWFQAERKIRKDECHRR